MKTFGDPLAITFEDPDHSTNEKVCYLRFFDTEAVIGCFAYRENGPNKNH